MRLRIHVITEGVGAEHNLELSGDMDLMTLKVLLEDESQIPMDEQILVRYTSAHSFERSTGCIHFPPRIRHIQSHSCVSLYAWMWFGKCILNW